MKLPISLPRGGMAWLRADLPLLMGWERGLGLQLAGQSVKVSAGRIWLPTEIRPRITGGLDDRMALPSAWLREAGGKLHMLLEFVGNQPIGELSEVKFIQDV